MFTVFIIMFIIRVGLFLNEIIKCDLCFFSLSLKNIFFFIRVAYFNHAANLLKYFDKLLKKRRQVAPQTVQELHYALVQIWEEIPLDTIHRLIRSMPRRCQACIQACGGHTNWVRFWVAAMKFQHNVLACCIIFSLWFLECLWIQPSVGW